MTGTIREWLKANGASAWLLGLVAVLSVAFGVLSACDTRRWISVDVPPAVAEAIDTAPLARLNEAPFIAEQWRAYVEANSKLLAASIDDAEARHGAIMSVVSVGIGAATEAAPLIPGGGILLSVLTLFAGKMLKRPGEDERVRAEKEASYNKGIEEGRKIAAELLAASKGTA